MRETSRIPQSEENVQRWMGELNKDAEELRQLTEQNVKLIEKDIARKVQNRKRLKKTLFILGAFMIVLISIASLVYMSTDYYYGTSAGIDDAKAELEMAMDSASVGQVIVHLERADAILAKHSGDPQWLYAHGKADIGVLRDDLRTTIVALEPFVGQEITSRAVYQEIGDLVPTMDELHSRVDGIAYFTYFSSVWIFIALFLIFLGILLGSIFTAWGALSYSPNGGNGDYGIDIAGRAKETAKREMEKRKAEEAKAQKASVSASR